MKIYSQEIKDGLSEKLAPIYASVQYCAPIQTLDIADIEVKDKILQKVVKAQNNGQLDLAYKESILITSCWNKNDDVALAEEIWPARHTPEDKQFNYSHNESDIIGHITGCYATDLDHNRLDDTLALDELPEEGIHIVTSFVLYKHWENEELQERMNTLLAEIEEGKWFTSMEALCSNFDYAIKDEDNLSIVIRNEETAFLTKHLRCYGGKGEYNGCKIGRVPRNLIFKGQGLVKKPANPDSVIFSNEKEFGVKSFRVLNSLDEEKELITSTIKQLPNGKWRLYSHSGKNLGTFDSKSEAEKREREVNYFKHNSKGNENGSGLMTVELDALMKEITELKASLKAEADKNSELSAQIKNLDAEKVQKEIEKLQANVEAEKSAREEAVKALDTAQTTLAETNDKLEAAEKSNTELKSELDSLKAEQVKADRVNKLVDAGFQREEAEAKVEKLANATDEVFAEFVEVVKQAKYGKDSKEDKKPDSGDKNKKEEKKDSMKSSLADLDTLSSSESNKVVNPPASDNYESLQAEMYDFLTQNKKSEKKGE